MDTIIEAPKRPPPILESARLILRPPRAGDVETLRNVYARDVEVTRDTKSERLEKFKDREREISRFLGAFESQADHQYIVEEKQSTEIVGLISIGGRRKDSQDQYVLVPSYRGKGYMMEIIQTLVQWNSCNEFLPYKGRGNQTASQLEGKAILNKVVNTHDWYRPKQIEKRSRKELCIQ